MLIGIDVGTSGLKGVAVRPATGEVVASATHGYPLHTPRAGWAEQDGEDFVRAARDVLAALAARLGPQRREVKAIGLAGQMHTALFLDAGLELVRPAILWCDTRTTRECGDVERALGAEGVRRHLGNRVLPGMTLPKILWLRRHEPDAFARVRSVVMPKDLVGQRLTGVLATDVSDASGTLAFDTARRAWSEEVLDALDLSRALFPDVADSPAVLGALLPEPAEATGLPVGTPVVRGAADNAAAAVGLGVVRAGRTMASVGTSGVVLAHTDRHLVDAAMSLHSFCHAVPGRYYLMGVMLAAGGALRWYRDVLCDGERIAAELREGDAYDVITEAASTARPGAGGVVFLPYLLGERTPHNDAAARGALVGLTARTGKADVSRAVLEGITFGLADSLDILRAFEPPLEIREIRLTGGAARSPFWRRLMADVFDAEVALVTSTEGPAFGAALLAGAGVGLFSGVEEAADALVHVTSRVAPEPAGVARYAEIRAAYRALYGDLRDRFVELGRLEG